MKYYIAPVYPVNGPEGKPLNFVLEKKPSTEEEFNKVIDDFFDKNSASDEAKAEGRNKLMDYLLAGKSVTVGEHCLTIKKR